jgi:hypothetical protein
MKEALRYKRHRNLLPGSAVLGYAFDCSKFSFRKKLVIQTSKKNKFENGRNYRHQTMMSLSKALPVSKPNNRRCLVSNYEHTGDQTVKFNTSPIVKPLRAINSNIK